MIYPIRRRSCGADWTTTNEIRINPSLSVGEARTIYLACVSKRRLNMVPHFTRPMHRKDLDEYQSWSLTDPNFGTTAATWLYRELGPGTLPWPRRTLSVSSQNHDSPLQVCHRPYGTALSLQLALHIPLLFGKPKPPCSMPGKDGLASRFNLHLAEGLHTSGDWSRAYRLTSLPSVTSANRFPAAFSQEDVLLQILALPSGMFGQLVAP